MIIDQTNKETIYLLKGHTNKIRNIVHKNNMIISGSDDHTIRIWI